MHRNEAQALENPAQQGEKNKKKTKKHSPKQINTTCTKEYARKGGNTLLLGHRFLSA